ncbi:MAG: hypothetical protein LKE40_10960 [Spirochaetia bacterium]|jgi:raffinose/stachyose/melibiose transport system permease protein|nr:hypothetical protein [Spirochaetia bacterium]
MNRRNNKVTGIVRYSFLVCGGILIVLPIYLTFIIPFKTVAESAANFFAFPKTFYLENFKQIISSPKYYVAFVNTIYVTVGTLLVGLLVMPMMSYAISRSMPKNKIYKRFLQNSRMPE